MTTLLDQQFIGLLGFESHSGLPDNLPIHLERKQHLDELDVPHFYAVAHGRATGIITGATVLIGLIPTEGRAFQGVVC